MAKVTKRGKFIGVGMVLAVVLIAAIGATVWYAYHSTQLADSALQSANKVSSDVPKTPVINSYDTCAKAPGSKILQSYPAQCVTTGGKTFTDTPKYLVIREWGMQFQIPSVLKTMKYTLTSADTVKLDSDDLSDLAGSSKYCSATLGSITRMTTAPAEVLGAVKIAHIGNYYYYHGGPAEACIPESAASESPIPSGKYPSATLQSNADKELLQLLPTTFGPSK